ncbi:MAG: diguanylate cyclase [Thermoanaerobaculales bacterium]|nr:diguanylate cyclase [Thermoanaerobaculales bacterium]
MEVSLAPRGVAVWWLLFFLLFPTVLSAQTLHVRNYSTDDGLPSSQVWCILQDSQGYIWFGTSNGLARYDGRKMTAFGASDGLVSNVVLAMVEDAGKFWIATDNGISCYHNGAFESFSRFDGKELGIVWSVARFGGYIWYGMKSRGLLRVDPRKDDNGHYPMEIIVPDDLKPDNSIFSFASAEDGLWIATAGGQLYRYDGNRFLECAKVFGLEGMILTNVLRTGDSTLWVGTSKHGVFRCSLSALEGKNRSAPAERYFPSSYIYSSAQAGNEMLFGSRYGGLASLEHEQQHQVTVKNGLCNNQIYSILVDREGSIWLGTNQGVTKILSTKFHGYLKGEVITSICEYRNALWFGTFEHGLIRLKDGEITRFTKKDGLRCDQQIFALVVFQGAMWIGGMDGLSSYDGAVFHAHTGKAPSTAPKGILSLHPVGDCLWIGTANWAWMYRKAASKDQFAMLSDTNKSGSTYFQAVAEDQEHRIWFGSPSGAYLYDPKHPQGRMQKVGAGDGLPAGSVNCIFRDSEGTLWLGAQTSLIRYQPREKEKFRVFSLPTTEGGSNSSDINVFSIIQSNGTYWLATNMGMLEFDGEKVIKKYTKQDGLIGNETTSASSLYRDSRGHIWFATYSGVTEYLPENDIPNTVPPPVVIEKAFFDNAPITEGHSFTYRHGTLRFAFTGLSFKDEKDVRYKYKLVGYDKDWSEITEKREVRYTNLDNGRYVFKVTARNADGYWSATPATVAFEILPPLWKKWWFLLLAVAAAGLLIRAGFTLRLKGIEREKRRLEKLVAAKTKLLTVQAITDGLTGAYNRSWFMKKLRQEIVSMLRRKTPDCLSLIILDIDQFKHFNDTYGHLVGDHALTVLVETLRGCVRENDTLARYGGDEFAIILPSTGAEGAQVVAEKMRETIECYNFTYKGHRLKIAISVGAGVWCYSGKLQRDIVQELTEKLVTEADTAMYEAKNEGGNRIALRLLQP